MSPLGLRSGKKKDKAAKAAAPAAPAPAPAQQPAAAGRGVKVEKPKANIYTALLALSFVALVVACICLYAEMSAYDMQIKARL